MRASIQTSPRPGMRSVVRAVPKGASAMRTYTSQNISPLLEPQMKIQFLPYAIPSFAAQTNFRLVQRKLPEYAYREPTLNPTNVNDRATDWETDIVNQFRGDTGHSEMSAARDTPSGISLFLARPIKVNNVSCLECHSTADKAPAEMIKLYGTANGFGWKLDDIIGAQIVSVPLAVPLQLAQAAFLSLLGWLIGAFLVILVVANVMVFVLARPKRG